MDPSPVRRMKGWEAVACSHSAACDSIMRSIPAGKSSNDATIRCSACLHACMIDEGAERKIFTLHEPHKRIGSPAQPAAENGIRNTKRNIKFLALRLLC